MNDLKRYVEHKRMPTVYESAASTVVPKKRSEEGEDEREVIIEEKIIDKYGNQTIRKYLRGKFLGKVGKLFLSSVVCF